MIATPRSWSTNFEWLTTRFFPARRMPAVHVMIPAVLPCLTDITLGLDPPVERMGWSEVGDPDAWTQAYENVSHLFARATGVRTLNCVWYGPRESYVPIASSRLEKFNFKGHAQEFHVTELISPILWHTHSLTELTLRNVILLSRFVVPSSVKHLQLRHVLGDVLLDLSQCVDELQTLSYEDNTLLIAPNLPEASLRTLQCCSCTVFQPLDLSNLFMALSPARLQQLDLFWYPSPHFVMPAFRTLTQLRLDFDQDLTPLHVRTLVTSSPQLRQCHVFAPQRDDQLVVLQELASLASTMLTWSLVVVAVSFDCNSDNGHGLERIKRFKKLDFASGGSHEVLLSSEIPPFITQLTCHPAILPHPLHSNLSCTKSSRPMKCGIPTCIAPILARQCTVVLVEHEFRDPSLTELCPIQTGLFPRYKRLNTQQRSNRSRKNGANTP